MKRKLFDRKAFVPTSQEHYFDLTGSETTEAYIFRAPIKLIPDIELFIAAAIWKMMEHLGFNYDELLSEVPELDIYPVDSWMTLDSDPLRLLNIRPAYDISIPELSKVQHLYRIEIGPCSVQEFYISRTQNEYVSLYWYTTG